MNTAIEIQNLKKNYGDTVALKGVNISIGDGRNKNSYLRHKHLSDEFQALNDLGVVVVAAAGNDYRGAFEGQEGAAYPSIDQNVISVGSSFSDNNLSNGLKRGDISEFSQRSEDVVDIFAPGSYVTAAIPGDGVGTQSGTSMAAPFISGVIVLAQQLADQELGRRLTPGDLVGLLKESGDSFVDGDKNDGVENTGIAYRNVNVQQLFNEIRALPKDPASTETIINNVFSFLTDIVKDSLGVGKFSLSSVENTQDRDWTQVFLEAGKQYRFEISADDSKENGLVGSILNLHDSRGAYIADNDGNRNSLIFSK